MRRIFLTQEQLGRVVNNIISEQEVAAVDIAQAPQQLSQTGTQAGDIRLPRSEPAGSGAALDPGSPNQDASGGGGPTTPNTAGGGDVVAGLNDYFGPTFTDDIGYDDSISNNLKFQQPTDFKGTNPTYLPGMSNDKGANLKLTGDFGMDGVKLNTMSGDMDIKIGKQFSKDMKKGKVHKKAREKHPELHPNRHKNSSRITNTVHPNAITRGGVTFDSSFKASKGGDPFSVKTS